MTPVTRLPYQGSALPGNAEVTSLYDSTINNDSTPDRGAGIAQQAGIKWFVWAIFHDQTGTVNGYFKRRLPDGTLSVWRAFYSQASAGGATADLDEVYIEPYDHVKFEWVNGATPQTIFDTQLIKSDDRAQAGV